MNEQFKSALDIFGPDGFNPKEVTELKDELLALTLEVKRQMDKGLSNDEIAPAKGLLAACRAAEEAVQKISGQK